MPQSPSEPLGQFTQQIVDYLPTLTAGAILVVLGVVIGWVVKRAVVRILVWLRLDRMGQKLGFQAALKKGDVRAPLYDLIGTGIWMLVTLVFLENALLIWGLDVLSRMIDGIIVFVPNLIVASVVIITGFLLSGTVATRVEATLDEEEIPRARLIAKGLQAALMTVVCALGLWQLNFAREIVLAAFLIGFSAVGVAFALSVGIGSAKAIQQAWDGILHKNDKP
ncbi:MAG: hypothetical protein HQ485_09295 [Acidobacteria bacterium]|nr:hypothetical protein [Acidobacteriota bacterium]